LTASISSARCAGRSGRRFDMRATKAFPFADHHRMEVFLETFNLTNHVNLSGYNGNMNTTSFLIPSSARPARQIQWGLRYSF